MLTVSPITGPQQLQPIHLWSGEVEHSVFHGVGSSAGQDDTKMFESMAMLLRTLLVSFYGFWYHNVSNNTYPALIRIHQGTSVATTIEASTEVLKDALF